MVRVSGVYTAIVTPFNAKGDIDEQGLRHNIRFQIEKGIDGIVSLGTTGEEPTLSQAEKEIVIRIAREETLHLVPLVIGTGSYSTEQAIQNTHLAQKLGADLALIVTPYYNRPTQEGLYRHYQAVAHAVDIPILIYNIQSRTGQNLHTDTLMRLADIPNIIGVKEASGNIAQIGEVIERIGRHRPDFSIMCGDDALTLPVLALGGHGVISVVSNLLPDAVKSLVDTLLRGDFSLAREIHFCLMPLFRAAFIETNPIPIKTAMNLWEMAAGKCRLPLCDLSPENEIKLKQILQQYSAKNVQSFPWLNATSISQS
jgi:4-hydroxy-tetrahydrodipicolinate synthase